ncbi:hypothetical protein CS022_02545 [Veronia nyctiphanis]|uniref:DUF218 domain-containing protein n=1 Tax=Veronia nyctiphanis TaxID=1278244 RepID=A0A4Q0YTD7_9GAMM|nr:YdcF family protein [Veronia nyctiphanis]RXJ74486.1 hypothetical protein CS022_02545 [Veronia nyctiphanis]
MHQKKQNNADYIKSFDWLSRAADAYTAKNRAEYINADGQCVNNMDEVIYCLNNVLIEEPLRLSAYFGIASAYLFKRQPQLALDTYKQILARSPHNIEALFHSLLWCKSLSLKDKHELADALQHISPSHIEDANHLFECATKWEDGFAEKRPECQRLILVVQGLKLGPQAQPTAALNERLEAAFSLWEHNPESEIIVTGGVPVDGMTEAEVMTQWLITRGVPSTHIIEERRATNTVQNALFTAEIISQKQNHDIYVVSCLSHLPRSMALLNVALHQTGVGRRPVKAFNVRNSLILTEEEKVSILCDAIRVYGYPAFDISPMYFR